MNMRMRILYVAVGLALVGCGPPCTVVAARRCAESVVEVCSTDRQWKPIMDCERLPRTAKPMSCQTTDAGAACLPR